MTRARVMLVLIVVMGLIVAPRPVPVFAASAKEEAPLTGMNVLLVYQDEFTVPRLGITARVADDEALPARVVLPVPEGAEIEFCGEMFLDGRENRAAEYTKEERNGVPVVAFTLRDSRLGHIELLDPRFSEFGGAGGERAIGFELTLPVGTGPLYAAIVLPPSAVPADDVQGLTTEQQEDGSTHYSIERPLTVAGEALSLGMRIRSESTRVNVAEGGPWPLILLAVGAFGVVAVIAYLGSARRRRTR